MKWIKHAAALSAIFLMIGCGSSTDYYFTVKIENTSNTSNLFSPLAPGAWAVHEKDNLLFTEEQTATNGLELLAEDGNPTTILAELQNDDKVIRFAKLSDEMIAPGNAYSFTTKANEGDYLSFATMFVKSNDLFFAPPQEGLALFPNGTPLEGDITAKIRLWDCGTEDNQTPGDGDQQPQVGSTTSGVPDPTPLGVRDKASFNDGHALPDVADLIRVTISVSFSAP